MPNVLPTDKNIYLSTDSVIRQVDCQSSFGDEAASFTIKLAGQTQPVVDTASNFRKGKRVTFSDLKAKFNELSALDATVFEVAGKVTSSTSTTKQGSAQATITISIPYKGKIDIAEGSTDAPDERKVVTWSEKSTQYEFPLGIYAGEGQSASDCNAGNFEAWKNMKTTDITKYKNFQYDLSGETYTLEGHTLDLAKKWYKGIEAVDRAYPEVVRTSNYYNVRGSEDSVSSDLIGEIDETPNLYHIDTTPDPIWNSLFDDFSWVKSAFDVDIQPTEYKKYWNITVTEAWIGIDKEERGEWDKNLYGNGNDRWKFADITGQDPGNGQNNGGNNNG